MFRRKELLYPHDDTAGGIENILSMENYGAAGRRAYDVINRRVLDDWTQKSGCRLMEELVKYNPEVVPDLGN